jgi:hypothetical protein
MNINSMDRPQLVHHLQSLVQEAKQYPAGELPRQKALTQAARILPHLLWQERSPYYNDALQQTLEHFCRKVDRYDPELGSVVTWLNKYLRWRLVDLSTPRLEIPFSQFASADDNNPPFIDIPDPVDRTTASILDSVQEWAETDPTATLRRVQMKKYPQVTAQVLILHRLPPETSWKNLSETLGISIPTLASFYQRQCLPRLREFGKAQGYL